MMMWYEIPGYPGYEITKGGQVRSWRHKTGKRKQPWILKQAKDRCGYAYVHCMNGQPPECQKVHRLLLFTFVGEQPEGMECRHLNGDPSDNRIKNLRWGTPKENSQDCMRHGRFPRGEIHGKAKLTNHDVLDIRRRVRAGEKQSNLAREFGVRETNISAIILRQTWRHLKC